MATIDHKERRILCSANLPAPEPPPYLRPREVVSTPRFSNVPHGLTSHALPERGKRIANLTGAAAIREFNMNNGTVAMLASELFPVAPLADYPGIVWVVGSGPSLKGFDFSVLEGQIVIGVNRSFAVPHATIASTIDMRFYNWIHDKALGETVHDAWLAFRGPKIIATMEQKAFWPHDKGVYSIIREAMAHKFPPTMAQIGKAKDSGFGALMLAIAMGAKDIGLLGFDMGVQADKKTQQWHHDPHPIAQDGGVYDKFIPMFRELSDWMRAQDGGCGFRITNYTPGSGLGDMFPVRSLDSVGKDIDVHTLPAKPVICTAYTRGTNYEREYLPLQHAAAAMGFEFKAYDYATLGSWHANCCAKPANILRALDDNPGRDVLFLDCDARLRQWPTLLTGTPGDFGYTVFDWANVPGSTRQGKETSSAVIYCSQHKGVRRILTDWNAACKANAATPRGNGDQEYLAAAINKEASRQRGGARIFDIPMSYNQIFDTMAGLGAPVIEQMQASRRMKREVNAG
jgi:hypothetical protein